MRRASRAAAGASPTENVIVPLIGCEFDRDHAVRHQVTRVRQVLWQHQPHDLVLDARLRRNCNRPRVDVEHAQHHRRDRLAEPQHHLARRGAQHRAIGRHGLDQHRVRMG